MTFRPEDYFGYWLFYTERAYAYAFNEALKACCIEQKKPYEVTPPQWGILNRLSQHDGATIGTLSQLAGLDAPTTTGIIKRLEQHGLVKRQHDQEDRRVVRVYFTEEGREMMQHLRAAALAFNEVTLRGFSEAERQDMITRLQTIVANLSALGPGLGDRFGLLPDFLMQEQQHTDSDEQ